MSRMSYTDHRRRRLARRIESLEAMEPRSMITESLGILSLGIGVPAALTGSKDAGTALGISQPAQKYAPRDQAQAARVPLRLMPADPGGGSARAVPTSAIRRVDASSRNDPATGAGLGAAVLGASHTAPFRGSRGGGGAASRGGSGPVAGGVIRPLRFAPPADAAAGSSTLMAGAGSAQPGASAIAAASAVTTVATSPGTSGLSITHISGQTETDMNIA